MALATKDIPAIDTINISGIGATMDIDKQRIAAVRTLEALGYGYQGGQWMPPAAATTPSPLPMTVEADALLAALMRRADALAGCTAGSDEEAELKAIVDVIEAYEVKRWPLGREPGRRLCWWSKGRRPLTRALRQHCA